MADEDRDPRLSRRYRDLPAEEPPRELDAAILAASRRAVEARPAPGVAPPGRRRWYYPVAAAAIIMLAVAVTVHVEREQPSDDVPIAGKAEKPAKDVATQAAPEPAKEEKAVPPQMQNRAQKNPEPRFAPEPPRAAAPQSAPAEAPAQRKAEVAENVAGTMSAQRPAPATAPAAPAARDEILSESRADSVGAAAGARAPQPQAAPRHAERALAKTVETPEQMLERIAELRRNGRDEEADKALAEFRKRFPDYRMTDEVKAKVERK
jgi:hypothetical protein